MTEQQSPNAQLQLDDIASVRQVSTTVATTITSWAPGAEAAGHATLTPLTSQAVLGQYDAAMAALDNAMPALGTTGVVATVQQVFVGPIASDEADVIVIVDLATHGANPRAGSDHYLRTHLARVGGTWIVDSLEDVNTALAASATTTTSS